MTTRVYQFGLLPPPMPDARLVREQLRAAHEYRNDLVAIERGRRWAIRQVDAASDAVREAEDLVKASTRSSRKSAVAKLRAARKAARDAEADELALIAAREHELLLSARANTSCFWGSYLDIEAAHRQSRAQPLYGDDAVTPNDPAFARGPRWRDSLDEDDPRAAWWLANGQVGVQLQGGLSTAEALACTDTRVRLEIRDEARSVTYGMLSIRVGSEGRVPIWASWPIKMHRRIPDSATWKWVRVSVRTAGRREVWTCEITVNDAAPPWRMRDESLEGAIAIEWEWTPLDADGRGGGDGSGGIRVARWADTRGASGAVILPARIVSGIAKPHGIRSVRDTIRNDTAPKLARLIKESGVAPRWLVAEANTMHLWQSLMRFRALQLRWQRERLCEPRAGYDLLDAWMDREDHLYSYESCARGEALRERREYYRVLAARWARTYRTVLLSGQDLSREARWGDDADVRFAAAPAELRMALRNAFGTDAIDARWGRDKSEDDEREWCERCRDEWIAGGAREGGMFAMPKAKTGNAWASRKAKKKSSSAAEEAARDPPLSAAE